MEYATPRPVWLLDDGQLAALRTERDTLRRQVDRGAAPRHVANRLRDVDSQISLAEDAHAKHAQQTRALVAEETTCGTRARNSTAAELLTMLEALEQAEQRRTLAGQRGTAPPAQEFMPVRPYWEDAPSAPPATAGGAASLATQRPAPVEEYMPLPRPYWEGAATLATNRSSATAFAANMRRVPGESFSDSWARLYVAKHPGERAYVA
jgi:hypothetical protein